MQLRDSENITKYVGIGLFIIMYTVVGPLVYSLCYCRDRNQYLLFTYRYNQAYIFQK
jgi:uncharacterized membrane protein YukC